VTVPGLWCAALQAAAIECVFDLPFVKSISIDLRSLHAGIMSRAATQKEDAMRPETECSQDAARSVPLLERALRHLRKGVHWRKKPQSSSNRQYALPSREEALSVRSASMACNDQPHSIYHALPEQRHIRLLELQPGHWDEPLQCRLLIENLDSLNHTYEAISYAWGDATHRMPILCNGVDESITSSLFDALRIFRGRPGERPRMLWADAVCIDQANLGERSHQVQLMRHIYSTASKVLLWVGHDSATNVQAGLDCVCQLACKEIAEREDDNCSDASRVSSSDPACYYVWRDTTSSETHERRPSRLDVNISTLPSLCALFDQPWFKRLWVIQEVTLSRAAELYWGYGSIDFILIGRATTHVLDHYYESFVQYAAFSGLDNCDIMFNIWTKQLGNFSFFDTLQFTRDFKASEPKDKIFGMLGLTTSDSNPDGMLFMEPDYSLDTVEVYTYVATKILVDQEEVDLLACVQHGRQLPDDWASWVPNWAVLHTGYLNDERRNTSGDAKKMVSKWRGSDVVSICGVVVDSIVNLMEDDFDKDNWRHPDLAKSMKAAIHELEPRFGGERLAYTLTAGFGLEGDLVEDHDALMVEYMAFKSWDFDRHAAVTDRAPEGPSEEDDSQIQAGHRFFANSGYAVFRRRVFVTQTGMLGLGPPATAEGDIVVVLFGGTVPFVLRPDAEKQRYRLVGECYVHDVMDGQAVTKWEESGEPATDFHIY